MSYLGQGYLEGSGSSGGLINPQVKSKLYEDFFSFLDNFTYGVAGSGANVAGGDSNHDGIVQHRVSALNDRASFTTQAVAIELNTGGGAIAYETLVQVPVLSTAAEEFVWQFGLGDTITGDQTDGLFWEYDRAVTTEWRFVVAAAGVRARANSGVAVTAGQWIRLGIETNTDGTVVTFKANGAIVGTVAAGLPGNNQFFGIISRLIKTVQTAAAIRDCYVDYVSYERTLNR